MKPLQRCILGVLLLASCLAFVQCSFAPPCGNCGNCPKRQECVPAKCKSCPALVSNFYPYSNNRTLIMKIHINNNHTQGDQITFYAGVETVYQGRSSGNVVQLLYQNSADPCFTNFFPDTYVVAIPYAATAPRPILLNPADAYLPYAPDCFFIRLNQCDYFKLYKDLTPGELAVLAAHGGRRP